MNPLSSIESGLIHAAGALLSRRGTRASLLVLIYHRVLPSPDPMLPSEPDAATFARHMDLLAENFTVLPLRDGVARLRQGSLPARTACITFDDGYANNFTVATPILRERSLPATVFVAPGYLDGGCMFNDMIFEACRTAPEQVDLGPLGLGELALTDAAARIRAAQHIVDQWKYLPREERRKRAEQLAAHVGAAPNTGLMMTAQQVAQLPALGIEIGAHTLTHPILTRLPVDEARDEIVGSRQRLEEITGQPILSFAYPNGRPHRDYAREHVAIVREAGFELAVSTSWGAATARSDPFQIPRIAPWDKTPLRYAARMVNAYREREFVCV
jgi:peptidoglycan/xylan/chitin deacetylase (PgdA/CDA1 family)